MKKIGFLTLTLVLTAVLFTGCGCTNQKMDNTSAPTVLPTNEENWTTQSTAPSATGGTTATTHSTLPGETGSAQETRPTADNGNGPLETNATEPTEQTGTRSRGNLLP